MKTKYVWLNLKTGEFSNSWDYEEAKWPSSWSPENLAKDHAEGFKLIKYECLNDDDFEFNNLMKLR